MFGSAKAACFEPISQATLVYYPPNNMIDSSFCCSTPPKIVTKVLRMYLPNMDVAIFFAATVPFSHVYPRQPGKNQAVTRSPEHRLAMDHLDEYWTIVVVDGAAQDRQEQGDTIATQLYRYRTCLTLQSGTHDYIAEVMSIRAVHLAIWNSTVTDEP
ncbi:hypothetical protein BC629DRAFT_1609411 [Irpex lacteus]|nr:hypothetical protein BC629DRAFT_1609411 [Irpex lacteus]